MKHYFNRFLTQKLVACLCFSVLLVACKTRQSTQKINIVPNSQMQAAIVGNFFEAQKEKLIGNNQKAAELFEAVLQTAPTHPAANYELARLELPQNKLAEAVKHAANAYNSDKKNTWYAKIYLQALLKNRELKQANIVYGELYKENSTDENLVLDYAQNLNATAQPEKALDVLNALELKKGISPGITDAKKTIYIAQNKPEKALKEIEKLASAYPNEPGIQGYLTQLYLDMKRYDKAQETLEKSIANNPNNAESLMMLSEMYRIKGDKKMWLQSVSLAFSSPTMDIDTKVKWLLQSLDFSADAEVSDSALVFAKQTTTASAYDPKAYAILGDVLLNQRQPQAAKTAYLQSISLDKTQKYAVWEQVLLIDLEADSIEVLGRHATEALEIFPSQPFLFYAQGYALYKQEKYTQSIAALNEGLAFVTENATLQTRFEMLLGEAYHQNKAYPLSVAAFEKAMRLTPNDALILNNYAFYLALQNGNLVKAENLSKRANDLNPANPSFEDTHAFILFKKGDYSGAKVWIENATLHSTTPDATLLEHKGDILFKLGLENEALVAWKEAQKLGTNNALLQKKINKQTYYDEE